MIKSLTKFNLNSIFLTRNYTLCNCTSKPRNFCDYGDHLASIRRMSFRSLQEDAGFEPPKKKTPWIWGIYSALFFGCIVEETLRSNSTLPSVLPEPYLLKMKLHPSLLLNKYKRSPALCAGSHFLNKQCLSADRRRVREVYKWRYGLGRTERLNFIKRVMLIHSNQTIGTHVANQ
jgi:hypothetical protein